MVKPPKIRHSRSRRDPVTIDLDAERVEADASESPSDGPAEIPATAPEETAAGESMFGRTEPRPDDGPANGRGDAPRAGDSQAGGSDETVPVPKPSGGFRSLAAALIGGAVALAGATALNHSGVLPLRQGDAVEVEALRSELTELRERIASLPPAAPAAGEDMEARLAEMGAQVAALRETVAALPAPAGASDLSPIEQRLAALETGIIELREADDPAGPAEGIGELEQRITSLDAAVERAAARAEEGGSAVAELTEAVAQIRSELAALSGRIEEQAAQPGVALAIAASALKAAIDRGDAFMNELETYAAVAPGAAQIQPLRDMAASGVPARAAIVAAFPDAASAMIAADRAEDPQAGFLDRLMASAQSLIQVRPVGMVEGDGVPAIVARMEVALETNDFAAALAEYEKLPQAPKQAGAPFMAKVRARLAADGLVDAILADALKS